MKPSSDPGAARYNGVVVTTNQPEPPPRPIPGQMDLYDVLADIDKETPVDKPTPASQVKPSTELSEEDRKQQRARNAVQSRLARTTALKRQGVNLVSADDS